MSERGLPSDGAPACPFVAFEDDRDGRATVPDHRHRCFAEPRPAPRALAHQEAYCLSSAFPVCPTFQDWARREAAAARSGAPSDPSPREEAPSSRPMPPLDRDPQHAPETDVPALPPRRNPPRDWAAPPPWTGDPASDPGAAGLAAAGYAADYEAPFADDPGDEPPVAATAPAAPSAAATPPPAADGWGTEARGLAGSSAYLLAGPDPDEPLPATPGPADPYEYPPVAARQNPAPQPPPRQPSGSRPPTGKGSGKGSSKPAQASPQAAPPAGAGRQEPAELFGPAWERPRRYEAYPTLRTRIGLPSLGGIPRLGIAGLALVLAALFLFFFGPMILGFGSKDPGGGAATTPRPTVTVTDTPEPTIPPPPTPRIYTVARGDTISKIAAKFKITAEVLLAANPQIKNPDKIKIGDKITIPVPVEGGGAGAGNGTVAGSTEP